MTSYYYPITADPFMLFSLLLANNYFFSIVITKSTMINFQHLDLIIFIVKFNLILYFTHCFLRGVSTVLVIN